MLRCMYSGISGMKANQTKLDVTGNNIANVSTTGFKASSARFQDMLYQTSGSATSPTSVKGGTNAKQVGLGVKLSSINKVMSQGNALSTGRTLDVCIDGDGYLMVGSGLVDYENGGVTVTPATKAIGGGNMDISYTRDGNLTLDHEGNLLTSDGFRVLGYILKAEGEQVPNGGVASADKSIDKDGKVHYINADAIDANGKSVVQALPSDQATDGGGLQPLKIPDKILKNDANGTESEVPVKSFSIGKDGVISAVLGDGSRSALGQIAMSTFKNPEGLVSTGGNLLQKSPNSGTEIIKNGLISGAANAATKANDNSRGFGDFIQGCLESSNVDLTEQFTDMIIATRSFQASSKMISTADEILQTVTGLMR